MLYEQLRQKISKSIYENTEQEITGIEMQKTLLSMVDALGEEGYLFKGVANKQTQPGVPSGQVFYFATEVGEYEGFVSGGGTGRLSVAEGEVAIFKFNGTSWSKELTGIASNEKLIDLEYKSSVFNSIIISETIEEGKYIADNGAISGASPEYRLAKFEIVEGGKHFVSGVGTGHIFLAKYTDNTYSVLDSVIIREPYEEKISKTIDLPHGYYAVSWIADSNVLTIISPIVGSQFVSAYFAINTINGIYINDNGNLANAPGYNTNKLKIDVSGNYLLRNIGNEHRILAKYTDAACTIFEKFIIEANTNYQGIVYLVSGYYALSWDTYYGDNPTFFNVDSIIDVANLTIQPPVIPIIPCEKIQGKYITNAGAIGNADVNYRLGKFEITKAGKYLFGNSMFNRWHPTLAKFADSSYSGNGEILIDYTSLPIDGTYNLDPGFYAICGDNYQDIQVSYVSDIEHILDSLYQKKHNFGGGITDFSYFVQNTADSWSIVSKDKIESISTGYENRIYYPVSTYEDCFIMSVVVAPKTTNNNLWEFAFGRDSAYTGTMIRVGQDSTGKFVALYCGETLFQRYDLSGLRMGIGKPISICLEKNLDTLNYFNLRVTDCAGNVFEQERITLFGQSTGQVVAGLGDGVLTMYAITGTFTLEKITFVYPKDANDIKLVVCGHSFVAGHNSTVFNQDKKFASLLAEDIGIKNTCVFGLGGGGVGMLSALTHQISWVSSVRYVIIMLGANDVDSAYTAEKFKAFNNDIKSMGAFPIWLSIPKLKDGTQAKPYLAQYIKDNFYYVDIDQIFVDENGDIIPGMFSDHIHPSIEGYRRMYEVIKNQCPFLFGI